ncbi:MAG: cobalamin-dependent protein [Mycobacteriales bacterium]
MTLHVPANPVRFVTSASLFDGHDAAINIMRRVLQSQGVEVIHLGHDRSVEAVVQAAVQEDAQGVAVSSYQGGHVEYFSYLVERLAEVGAGHVQVFGGGGGVIVPEEIALLKSRGVTIFAPEDGQRLGLAGMINTLVAACDVDLAAQPPAVDAVLSGDTAALARAITVLELGRSPELAAAVRDAARPVPVLGITGTGGSGKSSLTDELVRRFRLDQEDKLRIAVLAIDPTRRKGGGALLGDRIRMNSLSGSHVYFRSLATRTSGAPVPVHLDDAVNACKAAGFDLVVIETPGVGQGDASITDHCDVSLYVMTPEYGASSQLEKIDMLDHADVVAINKFERRGADDARRDVGRTMARNRSGSSGSWEDMPVFGTSAARFHDDGVTALYQHLKGLLVDKGLVAGAGVLPVVSTRVSTGLTSVLPAARERYLAEITATIRDYHQRTQ